MTELLLNLQLFAEGDASTGDSAVAEEGVNNPEEDVQTADAQADRSSQYKDLMKGEWKAEHDAEIKNVVQKRLKGANEKIAKYEQFIPVLESLGEQYGIDYNDLDALSQAVEEGKESFYSDKALEMGVDVDDYKQIHNDRVKVQQYERAERDRRLQGIISDWESQAEEARAYYPSLDLDAEMENEQFNSMLASGVPVRTAYEVLHQDEIVPVLMQKATAEASAKISNKIRANGARPVENGANSSSAAITKTDVSKLSDAQMDDIIRRVKMGDNVYLNKL